jgi:hypothetical protein
LNARSFKASGWVAPNWRYSSVKPSQSRKLPKTCWSYRAALPWNTFTLTLTYTVSATVGTLFAVLDTSTSATAINQQNVFNSSTSGRQPQIRHGVGAH